MGDAVLEDSRGKDCAFVANWLQGEGLNKLCAVFEVFKRVGNLRITTKFTTTTSVDWEKTGTRTSVSAGKRKLKMQSVGSGRRRH